MKQNQKVKQNHNSKKEEERKKKRQLRKKHRKTFKIAMSNNTYILGFVLEVLD